ncbi:MAG TPA: hypothetical protein VMT45_02620 [Thermoanaerobaculaceae bacterium]|nr:hypothetical protein [Thermoanaerobaculaceae bacterium]
MRTAHPELGVSHAVDVRIVLNMKDLLAKEEVGYSLVAGARNFRICDLGPSTIAFLVK